MRNPAETLARLKRVLDWQPGTRSSDFDLTPADLPSVRPLRQAAVLIPLVAHAGAYQMILTRRSLHLPSHAGQVAFPGGKVDPGDPTPLHTALREAQEEIGLHPTDVQVLGQMPAHQTVSEFNVIPYVGLVQDRFVPVAEPREVDEVFEVPFDFLMGLDNYQVHGRVWDGRLRRYYALPYGPHYIWGATARILRGLAESMART